MGMETNKRVKNDSPLSPILVSKREAARLLSLCVRSIEQLVARGELLAKRFGKRMLLR